MGPRRVNTSLSKSISKCLPRRYCIFWKKSIHFLIYNIYVFLGEYVIDGKCYPCHGSCSECSGSSSTQCTHCSNRTMHLGSCLEVCPQGTFSETGSEDSKHIQFCRPCPQACAQCDSMDHCTECLGVLQLQNGQCLASCEDG